MPDPDLRVSFYFTSQVNQIWSGLIPFYPIGLQLFELLVLHSRGGGGKWFDQGIQEWMDWDSNKIHQTRCPTSSMWGFDSLHPLQFSILHSEQFTAAIEVWVFWISQRIQFRIFRSSFNYRRSEGGGHCYFSLFAWKILMKNHCFLREL